MERNRNPQVILQERYQVVPRTIIFLMRNEEVLLLKSPLTKKIFPGKYNGIGGHIERLEDVFSAARRELQEESGLDCLNLTLAGTIMIDVTITQGIGLFVFTGNEIIGDLRESEEGSLHWVSINQLHKYDCVDDLADLLAWVQEFRRTKHKFSVKYAYSIKGRRLTTINWEEDFP